MLIQSPMFKTTSIPVMLDFLIRHGQITVENGKNIYLISFVFVNGQWCASIKR